MVEDSDKTLAQLYEASDGSYNLLWCPVCGTNDVAGKTYSCDPCWHSEYPKHLALGMTPHREVRKVLYEQCGLGPWNGDLGIAPYETREGYLKWCPGCHVPMPHSMIALGCTNCTISLFKPSEPVAQGVREGRKKFYERGTFRRRPVDWDRFASEIVKKTPEQLLEIAKAGPLAGALFPYSVKGMSELTFLVCCPCCAGPSSDFWTTVACDGCHSRDRMPEKLGAGITLLEGTEILRRWWHLRGIQLRATGKLPPISGKTGKPAEGLWLKPEETPVAKLAPSICPRCHRRHGPGDEQCGPPGPEVASHGVQGPPREAKSQLSALARKLFATDPRVLTAIAKAFDVVQPCCLGMPPGSSASWRPTPAQLLRAWEVENALREEALARANTIVDLSPDFWLK